MVRLYLSDEDVAFWRNFILDELAAADQTQRTQARLRRLLKKLKEAARVHT